MIRPLLVLALSAFALSAAPDAPDLAYVKTLHYLVRETPGGYQLSADISVQQTALTERATRLHTFQVLEQPYTTLSDLQGTSRGKRLDADNITFHYPRQEDTFVPAGRTHQLDFPANLKVGDTVSYAWKEVFTDLAFFPVLRIPAINQVERFEIRIDHPANLQVTFSPFFPRGPLPFKEDRSLPTRTVLLFEKLPWVKSMPHDPFEAYQAAVLVRIQKGTDPLTPSTPERFAQWYSTKVGPPPAPSEAMKALLGPELQQAATPLGKARLLFDFVRSHIRYIADEAEVHAFVPHTPAFVLEKKYGDCKDKAWLLAALGRIHGLKIVPVLLSTDPEPDFTGLSPNLFNHVICALEDHGEWIFMDPTWTHGELGDLPDADILARGLLLDPEQPRMVTIPSPRKDASVEVHIEGDLEAPRKARATITLRHAWRAQAVRSRKELKALDLENQLSNQLNRLLAKVSLDHIQFVDLNPERIVFTSDADLSEFLVRTDLRIYVPSAPFRAIPPDMLDREHDLHPLDAAGPDSYRLELALQHQGARPNPEGVSLGGTLGAHYRAACADKNGKVVFSYAFDQPYRQVPPASRTEFMQFCTQYLQLNRRLFTLTRTTP